ncbi:relaxase/mobilization nuclease domain-containing protein [Ruminococcus sp.]|uniref:relaxase/mobilization nuclease domain-containing protein n=1 Tax=Ruminococcus sp. TaxID=41978 RepID=UPI002E81285A|nr:relaxase/mobilization nuclease domain-containing protein [Ruminococcus sp.]MEE3493264.1 relaxase/mobilization nuclease domain-containing protein [Ruminococcus sp.]
MGTTKIWAIKDSLSRVLDYAANPHKTIYSDLRNVLHYAGDEAKTGGAEKACFVTGVNCSAVTAFDEMRSVQERFGKTTGNVAYHAYQSFKTDEVTPELCHRIGVELARKMWGGGYQVLVATHFNTGTYHNHFVVNAVNMWDGKKFNCNEGAYWKFRALSDELCAEHRLTIIKNPQGKTPRSIYFAEKRGDPTTFNLMREAIDYAITCSRGFDDFKRIMRDQGYFIDLNPNRKYWTIRSENSKKAVRMYRLGENYSNDSIKRRIYEQGFDTWQRNADYTHSRITLRDYRPTRRRFIGSFKQTKKRTGLVALYMHYCYLLGYYPKNRRHQPLSPEMKEAWRHLDRLSDQVRLVSHKGLNTIEDVHSFIAETDQLIQAITADRQKVYNKLRRCHNGNQRSELLHRRDDCTAALTDLRKEKKIALTILEDNPTVKENIRIETQMRNETYGLQQKQRHTFRSYGR